MDGGERGQALLEREEELSRIAALLRAVAGGDGGVLAIEGGTGIGKTALVQHARAASAAAGLRVLSAQASELERDYAFGVVRQWLEPVLIRASEDERRSLLSGAAAFAAPVLLDQEPRAGDRETAHRVLHGLYWLIAGLAERVPTLLIADDAHWADDASLRLLNFLVPRLDGAHMALLIACRPPPAEGTGVLLERVLSDGRCELLRPRPLSEAGVATVLEEHLGQAPEAAFLTACASATGGNPFYVRELSGTLAQAAVAPTDAEVDRLEELRPRDLSRVILSRISDSTRAVAEALAVLDEPGPPDLLGEIAGVDRPALGDAVAELARAGLIEETQTPRFVHAIVQSAVLAGLSQSRRAALHASAAAALHGRSAGPERVAVHLLETPPQTIAWGLETLRKAAELAAARGAPEVAVRLLGRALEEAPSPAVRAELLGAMGFVESELDLPEAPQHLLEAARLTEDPLVRARALQTVGWALNHIHLIGDLAEYRREVDRAVEEIRERDEQLALTLEAVSLSALILSAGGREIRPEWMDRIRTLTGAASGEPVLLALAARYEMDRGSPASTVAELAERAIASLETLREQGPNSGWLLHSAVTLIQAERLDAVEPFLRAAIELARERGSATGFALASTQLARVELRRGKLREAEADARAAVASGGAGGRYRAGSATPLIEVLLEQGRVEEAQAAYDAAGFGTVIPEIRPMTPLVIARGELRQAQGDRQGALADFSLALERLARFMAPNAVGLDARLAAALLRHELGDAAEAAEAVEHAVAIARAWGPPGDLGQALRVQGLVLGGEQGLDLLRQAVEKLASSPLRLEQGRALIDLGAALRRRGARSTAREPLREGLRIATWAGAAPLAERARQELAATGVRVRREGARDRLTPSEQRIVEMALTGATNPQIAQSLFVTVKTVETHLANAYRKLNITSRRQLPEAVAAGDRS